MDAKNFFEKRGFGQPIGFGKSPALLVIDVMKAFTDESFPLGSCMDNEVLQICSLLKTARKVRIPIIFTSVQYDKQDLKNAGLWIKKIKGNEDLLVGTPTVEIDTRLNVQENEHLLIKKYASCFFGTDLIPKLNYYRVDTLIICGCTTSGCVRATAVDAISYGYRPIIGKEAVADRSESAHRQSLQDLALKYADVVSVKTINSFLEAEYAGRSC